MKSIQLTEGQISAVVNYLLGTELTINAALQALYIEAEQPGYFANELDSVSERYLEQRIFKCAVCNVWSKMFARASETIPHGETPACEICLMSSEDILNCDSHFLSVCGIGGDLLPAIEDFQPCPDIAIGTRPNPNGLLLVTDADLDFLSACGIGVRLGPKDAARRRRATGERGRW